jgi:hypothetical protein
MDVAFADVPNIIPPNASAAPVSNTPNLVLVFRTALSRVVSECASKASVVPAE